MGAKTQIVVLQQCWGPLDIFTDKCWERTASSPGVQRQRLWECMWGGRGGTHTSLGSSSVTWHLPFCPAYFTLPRECMGTVFQEASPQSLALVGGLLVVKLHAYKHTYMHAAGWVQGRTGQCPRDECSSSLVSPCMLTEEHGQCSLSWSSRCLLGLSRVPPAETHCKSKHEDVLTFFSPVGPELWEGKELLRWLGLSWAWPLTVAWTRLSTALAFPPP